MAGLSQGLYLMTIDYVAAIISIIVLITTLFFSDWLPLVALIITLVIVFIIIWKLLEE